MSSWWWLLSVLKSHDVSQWMAWSSLAVSVILCSILLLARLIQAIRSTHFKRRPSTPTSKSSTRSTTCRTYILLGSGGHTGEMMRLLSELPFDRYTPRLYIISSGDKLSKTKALELEANKSKGDFSFLEIPRARRVHQSFFTTPWSTVVSLIYCLWYITLSRPYPDLVLLNGPGSSVPIALAAFLPRILHLRASPRLIYVESLARVQRLSLSGTILLPFMDVFIVQWDRLALHVKNNKSYQFLSQLGLVAQITSQGWMV